MKITYTKYTDPKTGQEAYSATRVDNVKPSYFTNIILAIVTVAIIGSVLGCLLAIIIKN